MFLVCPLIQCVDAKGGKGGGGVRFMPGGSFAAGSRRSRGLSLRNKVAIGAAVGVAGYAAYKSPHRFHSNRKIYYLCFV